MIWFLNSPLHDRLLVVERRRPVERCTAFVERALLALAGRRDG